MPDKHTSPELLGSIVDEALRILGSVDLLTKDSIPMIREALERLDDLHARLGNYDSRLFLRDARRRLEVIRGGLRLGDPQEAFGGVQALNDEGRKAAAGLEGCGRTCALASQWVVVLVPNAWTKFISGRQDAYERTVADFANQFKDEYDAVFLSQASMMGAAIMCDYENVLTSPGPGVQRLIDALGNSLTS